MEDTKKTDLEPQAIEYFELLCVENNLSSKLAHYIWHYHEATGDGLGLLEEFKKLSIK